MGLYSERHASKELKGLQFDSNGYAEFDVTKSDNKNFYTVLKKYGVQKMAKSDYDKLVNAQTELQKWQAYLKQNLNEQKKKEAEEKVSKLQGDIEKIKSKKEGGK